MRIRPGMRSENGSAPAAVLAWIGMSVTILGMLSLLGLGLTAQARAATAADLSALAGADALAAGTGDACTVAADAARRNDAEVTACRIEGQEVLVTAGVDAGSLPQITASARAGPAPDGRTSEP